MTTTTKFLLLVGSVTLYALFTKARTAANLIFYPGIPSDLDISGGNPILKLPIQVQNVGGTPLTLRSVAGNVYANNVLIGNASNIAPMVVPGYSKTILNVSLQLSWFGIVQDIIKAFQGNGGSQEIKWDCYFSIEGLPEMQHQPITIKIG